jgi:hypothetical protein
MSNQIPLMKVQKNKQVYYAYDTTWKYGILKDLFDMGLKGNLPTFISNVLSDREFNVRVYSTYSDIQNSQGSIISATLFSIKINSLAKVLSDNIWGSLYVHFR